MGQRPGATRQNFGGTRFRRTGQKDEVREKGQKDEILIS
jgi:hypothetical protein